jgi:hypothetical protein
MSYWQRTPYQLYLLLNQASSNFQSLIHFNLSNSLSLIFEFYVVLLSFTFASFIEEPHFHEQRVE